MALSWSTRKFASNKNGVSLNLLWALEEAIRGCDWREISPEDKHRLRMELAELFEPE